MISLAPPKELRARARYSLENNVFGKTWLFSILAYIIAGAVIAIATPMTLGLATIFIGPAIIGVITYYLNTARYSYETNHFKDLLCSLKKVRSYFLFLVMGIYIGLWSILFVIPGIVKLFSYSMAPFIMADDPDIGINEAITKSREMMYGYKLELFKLLLSFIGWGFVAFVFFPAAPWILSYLFATLVEFYNNIKENGGSRNANYY